MKKKLAVLILASCMLASGCGGKSKITTGNEKIANEAFHNDSISLAPYTGLKAEKKVYTVTEDAVDDAIRQRMLEFADYQSVSRKSKDGDWVRADFKASIDGKTITQEGGYDFTLGEHEFGAEFDKKLTGVVTGDKLTFSIDYDNDFTDVEWAGKTVDFEINVIDVQEELLPELTDKFIKENLEYNSYDEFEAAMRKSVENTYAAESTGELQETLLQQVIDASSILEYSKKDYDEAREVIESGYAAYVDMLGMESLDELYDSLEMTKEDLEEEITESLYRTLTIKAIIESESLSLSDEDYEEGIAYYMEQNEYDSREEFINDYGEDEIRRQLLEDMALNFLVNNADVTEVKAEYENN